MKKVLSTILAMAMLITLFVPMTASAIDPITLPTTPGESVLIEAEDYADQYYRGKQQLTFGISEQSYDLNAEPTAENQISGGKAVYSGATGNELVTITFPVSVESATVFELETVAGYGGHLDQNYWTLDGTTVLVTSTAVGSALNWRFTTETHYPAGIFTTTVMIPAGAHNLTYNLPKRPTMGGAFAFDYVKLTATDEAVPEVLWKEEAATSVKTNGTTVAVTFEDNAVEMISGEESSIKKYYIEVYAANTKVMNPVATSTFDAYEGDIIGEDGLPVGRPDSYTAVFDLPKTLCGTFYAKIYPVSEQFASIKGEPISTENFTITEEPPVYADRYELEDYWNIDLGEKTVIRSTAFASGGKMIASMQDEGLWTETGGYLADPEAEYWQDTYEMEFDVEIPADGVYDIETVMGMNKDKYTDLVSVSVDGDLIYTNFIDEASENLSINGTYPWSYTYACSYNAEKELTAGTHTVTISMTRPEIVAQPHLFALDYIQFTPSAHIISQYHDTVLEMEDYASDFVVFDEAGNTDAVNPGVVSGINTSGGKFITKDYTPKLGQYPVKVEIPVTVKESGIYTVEAMESYAGCDGFVAFVNADGETITAIEKLSNGKILYKGSSGLDAADPYRKNFCTYYGIKWHGARQSQVFTSLDAGEYTLVVQYNNRPTNATTSAMAFCIDYVKVTPFRAPDVSVFAEGETVIEAEDFADYFLKDNKVGSVAVVGEHPKASGGKVASKTETMMETGHFLTLPVVAEKAGWYYMGSVMSIRNGVWTSQVTLSVNGEAVIVGEAEYAEENLSYADDGKTYDFMNESYKMYRFREMVYLNEGENELQLFAAPRTGKTDGEKADDEKAIEAGGQANPYRVGYYIDYISFEPVWENITRTSTVVGVVVYDEPITGQVVMTAYKNNKLVGIQVIDMENDTAAFVDMAYSEIPDTVKAIAVDDFTKLKPQAALKDFHFIF